jgi:IclR family acetate operon transcriptional repressor
MEQEVGVRCVAVRLPGALARVAISVSGPSGRLTEARVGQLAPLMHDVAVRLAAAQQGAAGPESGAVTGPAEEARG